MDNPILTDRGRKLVPNWGPAGNALRGRLVMQIVVLGMHRSGTSSVTRLINMMGAYAGGEGDLM